MAVAIQVGNRILRTIRDWDINTNQVLIMFQEGEMVDLRACLWSVPIVSDLHPYDYKELELSTDDYYMTEAIRMMEQAGGFAAVATARTPGEAIHFANLKASYGQGYRDGVQAMKREVELIMCGIPHLDLSALIKATDAARAKCLAELE